MNSPSTNVVTDLDEETRFPPWAPQVLKDLYGRFDKSQRNASYGKLLFRLITDHQMRLVWDWAEKNDRSPEALYLVIVYLARRSRDPLVTRVERQKQLRALSAKAHDFVEDTEKYMKPVGQSDDPEIEALLRTLRLENSTALNGLPNIDESAKMIVEEVGKFADGVDKELEFLATDETILIEQRSKHTERLYFIRSFARYLRQFGKPNKNHVAYVAAIVLNDPDIDPDVVRKALGAEGKHRR